MARKILLCTLFIIAINQCAWGQHVATHKGLQNSKSVTKIATNLDNGIVNVLFVNKNTLIIQGHKVFTASTLLYDVNRKRKILSRDSPERVIQVVSPKKLLLATGSDRGGIVTVSYLKKSGIALTYHIPISVDGGPDAISNSEKLLAVHNMETVELIDIPSKKRVRIFKGNHTIVRQVVFSKDDKIVVVSDTENHISVWDISTGTKIHNFVYPDYLWNFNISPDGKMIAATGVHGAIVWSMKTWKELRRLDWQDDATPKSDVPGVQRTQFSPDGAWLAVGYGNGDLEIWTSNGDRRVNVLHTNTDTSVWHLNNHGVENIAFSPDSKIVAIGYDYNPYISLWDWSH